MSTVIDLATTLFLGYFGIVIFLNRTNFDTAPAAIMSVLWVFSNVWVIARLWVPL